MDGLELAKRYKTAIEESLGLLARIENENRVVTFKYPEVGVFFFVIDAKDDPEYMTLVFPSFADKDLTGGNASKLLELVNKVNGSNKAVKLSMQDDSNVTATIECFLAATGEAPGQALLNSVIKRNVTSIRAAVATLRLAGMEDDANGDSDAKSSA